MLVNSGIKLKLRTKVYRKQKKIKLNRLVDICNALRLTQMNFQPNVFIINTTKEV